MATTIYTTTDLFNFNRIGSDEVTPYEDCLVNASDAATDFYVDLTGSDSQTLPLLAQSLLAPVFISAEVNHDDVTNPITPTAHITQIELAFQINFSQTATINLINTNTEATAEISASCIDTIQWQNDDIFNWAAGTSFLQLSDIDPETINPSDSGSATAALPAGGQIFTTTMDFTTDPNGDFPLGYMDYTTFISVFSFLKYYLDVESLTDADYLDGSGSCGASIGAFQLTNFEMRVTWNEPITLTWTVSPTTVTIPPNVITISRPDPGVPPEEDTEALSEIFINGKKITPNDPWVTIWTRIKIIIHIPPFEDPTEITEIEGTIIGTEFTGPVPIQTIEVNYADLSGIYQLDDSVHTDTLYDRTDTESPTTVEVAIPAPFFVTYFVDSKESDVLHYTGTRMRVTGAGTLKQVFQSLDYINTEEFGNLTLRTSNNLNPFALANFIDQNASLRVYMDTIEDFMNVSNIIIFSRAIATGWPQ